MLHHLDIVSRVTLLHENVVSMLKYRGYLVTPEEEGKDREYFLGLIESQGSEYRESLSILLRRKCDPTDKLVIFFLPQETTLTTATLKVYCSRMKDFDVVHAILILVQGITSVAKKSLVELPALLGIRLECFQEAELLMKITAHSFVSKHTIMSPAEKQMLLKRYSVSENRIPRIQENDAMARYLGATRGEILKIIRVSESAGFYVTYRLVV